MALSEHSCVEVGDCFSVYFFEQDGFTSSVLNAFQLECYD